MSKNKQIKQLMYSYEIKITPIPEELGGGFEASIPQLGRYAFVGDGDTPEEALDSLELLSLKLLKEYITIGEPIPEPAITDQVYSGKFVLRIPKSLHRALAEVAERDSVSLNQMVIHLLSSALQQDSTKNDIARIERKMDALRDSLGEWKSSFVFLGPQPTAGLTYGIYAEKTDAAAY